MRRFFTIIALFCMTISAFSQGVVQSGFEAGTKGSDEQNLFMQGDANSDGVVDVVDLQKLAVYILEIDTQINIENADVNKDDDINIYDIVIIRNIIINRQYVDLGLPSGVQWATCNVGAETSEDRGDYFAWGETSPKRSYSTNSSLTRGLTFTDITTNPEYDAARANWGGFWRMPTNAECLELLDECTFEFITQNEVDGYKVTGPNGNYIFMPAAGYYMSTYIAGVGACKYWSSTPCTPVDIAYDLSIPEDYDDNSNRSYGLTVRPVITLGVDYPSVTTNTEVSDITFKSAVCGGNVTDAGGGEIIVRGVCWSTSPSPTAGLNSTMEGTGLGEFTSTLDNLEPNTTYYARAYVTNAAGISYGEEVTFTTEPAPIVEYEYVDLGLPSGLKWATFNVGAYYPEDYGDYFAWGEIETKETYTQDNCITLGVEMDDISGNPEYDAATANCGEEWRMPTEVECNELVDECTWEWTTQNGVNGHKVTGPNGNYIFIPAAGCRSGASLDDAGDDGYYWSSTPSSNNDDAYDLYAGKYYQFVLGTNRYRGRTIRPVKAEEPEYEYVDLGLPSGLKWATCNVGAENPEDYGDYFAWGEIEPKDEYTEDNSIMYGVEMEDISGNPQYDAATANWGSTWRMPTEEECEELVDECTWQWTTQNGVYGRKVTGPNGNHIFLPAAGIRYGSSLYSAGASGVYWSSTPYSNDDSAYSLYFSSFIFYVLSNNRHSGRSVRPVSE